MPQLHYINIFRATAIFFIVAVHALHVFSWPDGSLTKQFLDVLLNNGSIFFIFISGYLFQHLSVNFKAPKYYLSKLKNVVLPYLIISTPAIVYFVYFSQKPHLKASFYELPIWQQFVQFYAFGYHLSPMWFIPVIFTYYLLAPLLVKADKTRFFYYTLPVFILISYFAPRGIYFNNVVHFFSIYMLGMFCSKYKPSINQLLNKKSVLILLLVLVLGLANFEYFINLKIAYVSYLQKFFLTLLLFGVFIKYESLFKNKVINLLAETSFGVFFIHSYVLGGLKFLSKNISQALNLELPRVTGNIFFHLMVTLLVLLITGSLVLLITKVLKNNAFWLVGNVKKLKTNNVNDWAHNRNLSKST